MASNGSRYRRRDTSEWSALLAEQAASGQSQRAFCAARGVALSSFCAAKRRLGGGSDGAPAREAAEFVAIPVGALGAASWALELDLGEGVVLRLRRG